MKEQKSLEQQCEEAEAAYGNNYYPTDNGWVKAIRSPLLKAILARSHHAACLLWVIALRAWRGPGKNGYGCGPGEAFIGDWAALGFTEKTYRVSKEQLAEMGLCSFRATNKGTVATLLSAVVFDINIDEGAIEGDHKGRAKGEQGANKGRSKGEQGADEGRTEGEQGANEGRTEGEQGATNKKLRIEEIKTSEIKKEKSNNNTAGAGSSSDLPPSGEDPEVASGVIQGAAIPEADQEMTPTQKAIKLSTELPRYVKKVAKLNQLPVFTRSTMDEAIAYFSRNTNYEWWDVVGICALGIKNGRENPPTPKGELDPYWHSRNYAHKPNMLFDVVKGGDHAGDLRLAVIQAEVKYATDAAHDADWFNKFILEEYAWARSTSA